MTEPIAVDVPGKPAFARSVPGSVPLPSAPLPVPGPAPAPAGPIPVPAPRSEPAKSATAVAPPPAPVPASASATAPKPATVPVPPPIPTTPPPVVSAPITATGLLAKFTRKQLVIGASAVLSLAAGIGLVRVVFPAKDTTQTSTSDTNQTAIQRDAAPTNKPTSREKNEPAAPALDKNGLPIVPLAPVSTPYPYSTEPVAPTVPPSTLKPNGITPAGGGFAAPSVNVEPAAPLRPPSIPGVSPPPDLGALPVAPPKPPAITPLPPGPDQNFFPTVPVIPTAGTDPTPKPPAPPISPLPATPLPPITPVPGGTTPNPTPVVPVAPPAGTVPKPDPSAFPMVPAAPDPLKPGVPLVTPPGGVAVPVVPPPSVMPPEVKPDFKPVPVVEPPIGLPTSIKPGGGTDVKPTISESVPRTGFDVDLHDPKAADSYESISQEWYNHKGYWQALRAYNNYKPLQGGHFVEVPPMHVLRKKYPTLVPASAPVGGASGTSVKPGPSAATEPNWAVPPKPEAPARTAGNNRSTYVVPTSGWTMVLLAREFGVTWDEIHKLNQAYNPSDPLPAGTELKMPANARLP